MAFLTPEIINHYSNCIRLAVATSGYYIQSQLLHIPDRCGIFSTGHPRLQEGERTALFSLVMAILCISHIGGGGLVLLGMKLAGMPHITRTALGILALTATHAACAWSAEYFGIDRDAGSMSGKLRKE